MPSLKCPNPNCPFLFDPGQVPPGSVLTCPRCAMRFMLGPPAPTSASEYAPPPAEPATTTPAKAARPKPSGGGASVVAVLLGVVAIIGTIVAIGYVLMGQMSGGGTRDGSAQTIREYNFQFASPGSPWEKDPNPPPAARANLFTLKRSESEARMAFAASDFQSREPLPGDLREPLLDRLRNLFDDLDPTEEKGTTWAGKPAVRYTFRGIAKTGGGTVAGEAVAIGHQGIGYWGLAWAPQAEAAGLAEAFEQVRGRFTLLDLRSDWKPTTTSAVVFLGDKAEYKLVDSERWWSKPDVTAQEAADDDPDADLVLWAKFKSKAKVDRKPRAELIAYVLSPDDTGPMAALRAHVARQHTKREELFGPIKLVDLTGEPQGDPPSNTEQQGIDTIRLHAQARDVNTSKLLVLAALTVGDKVVGVVASCPWSDRHLWERRLMFIAGSLRPGR